MASLFRRAAKLVTTRKPASPWRPSLLALEDRRVPAMFTVTNLLDSNSGSLRAAVLAANDNGSEPDSVMFNVPGGGTIALATILSVDYPLNIIGPATRDITLSGGGTTRLFTSTKAVAGAAISISDLTLSDGKAVGSGGAILAGDEAWTLTRCQVTNNTATVNGGAIQFSSANLGTLTVDQCTASNNQAAVGGFANFEDGGGLVVTNSTLSNNTATNAGGALFLANAVNPTAFSIVNSTLYGNSATSRGGAIAFYAPSGNVHVKNSTLTGNSSNRGGGIDFFQGSAVVTLSSTVVAGNTAISFGADVNSAFPVNSLVVHADHCAIGSISTFNYDDFGGNLPIGTSLKLDVPADNGGLTKTILPLPGSPLVDVGVNPNNLTVDQRGLPRVVGTTIDIGASEAVHRIVTNTNDAGPGSLRQAIQHTNSVAGADTIDFDFGYFNVPRTIVLTSGELAIADAVRIVGPAGLTISGNKASRIFNTAPAPAKSDISLFSMTLVDGSAGFGEGGAIAFGDEYLTLGTSTIRDCIASRGGAIDSVAGGGTLRITQSSIYNNSATLYGGGICLDTPIAAFTIEESGVIGNTATLDAGGILLSVFTDGFTAFVDNVTLAGNTAKRTGGGIYVSTTPTLCNLVVRNSTIVGNVGQTGSAGGISAINSNLEVQIDSSIVAKNSAVSSANIAGYGKITATHSAIESIQTNGIFSADAMTTALMGADLKLGPLVDNGGRSLSIMPLLGSPLIDVGANAANGDSDQRGEGFPRVLNGLPDIGAIETLTTVVTNTKDAGPGSLRQIIDDIGNVWGGTGTITFDSKVFATPLTIELTSGQLSLRNPMTIQGPGPKLLTIDALGKSRVFTTDDSSNSIGATISGLRISGGFAPTGEAGGAIAIDDDIVTIDNCIVEGNTSDTNGGGIYFDNGELTVSRSSILNNEATQGGGISIGGGSFLLRNSAVVQNYSNGDGSALYFGNTDSAVSLRILNSTISNNTAVGNGGGICFNEANTPLIVQNSTIAHNSGIKAGGIYALSAVNLESTINVENNGFTGPEDFFAATAPITAKTSLIGTTVGVTNFTGDAATIALLGQSPGLSYLIGTDGPTPSITLLAGSPALNAGSNPAGLTVDQRGRPRAIGAIDIGAFELQAGSKVANVVINGGASQRSQVTSVRVDFDSPVIFRFEYNLNNAFSLARAADGAAVGMKVSLDATGTAVTLTFIGGAVNGTSLADGRYNLAIYSDEFDSDGFDGNGDGIAGDDYVLAGNTTNKLFRLFGDADGDGDVDNSDFVQLRTAFGNGPSIFDADGDGDTDNADFVAFRSRFGTTVP